MMEEKGLGSQRSLNKEAYSGLLEALRKDADAGTLSRYYPPYLKETVYVELVYDASTLQPWFEVQTYYAGELDLRGNIQSVPITREDVNTMEFLEEWGTETNSSQR